LRPAGMFEFTSTFQHHRPPVSMRSPSEACPPAHRESSQDMAVRDDEDVPFSLLRRLVEARLVVLLSDLRDQRIQSAYNVFGRSVVRGIGIRSAPSRNDTFYFSCHIINASNPPKKILEDSLSTRTTFSPDVPGLLAVLFLSTP
jgi:hypothetical protein